MIEWLIAIKKILRNEKEYNYIRSSNKSYQIERNDMFVCRFKWYMFGLFQSNNFSNDSIKTLIELKEYSFLRYCRCRCRCRCRFCCCCCCRRTKTCPDLIRPYDISLRYDDFFLKITSLLPPSPFPLCIYRFSFCVRRN